ncbi:MAG TPA: hypothetical protein VG452_06170 [Egibacteraceae bacterium]|nr:hypothetical protein [Egibacteraceae bacterium]
MAGAPREPRLLRRGPAGAGYRLLRYTWLDIVHQPDRVVAEIRQALHPRGLSSW